ncbi:Ig-like domain-containing protein [Desertivirga brevis]|uniref:Ig-like domain-containing protein n=1 Tax=Desertivirga brevis TaxID=2810310 RepID=UPI001A9687A7|nr:Ig-like domain-containing protein [Pedobacter sp. SYSU D00873]
MPLNQKQYFKLILLTLISTYFLLNSCASIQQPTGGPKDTIAPKILRETPKNFTTNFNSPQINIELDEYFKLNNIGKEISLSPDVNKQPDYRIKKKTLNVKFQDTLEANTTYTINFGNAIADYNEGNLLKNYVYVFSTGNKIDSLSISGTVINSLTKKPQLDATVFIIPMARDTIFGKRKANIFTTTDSSGNFKLRYLKEGSYKIYSVFEKEGGDKIYNSTNEEVAFLNDPIELKKDVNGIQLQLFKEEPTVFRVTDRKIENSGRIIITYNQKLPNPSLRILGPDELNRNSTREFSKTGDTALLWTKDMTFDSLQVVINNNSIPLDTVVLRRSKRDDYKQDITITDNAGNSRIKPGNDYTLTFSSPVASIDTKNIILLQDSVPVKNFRFEKDTSSTRRYNLKYSWKAEKNYDLSIPEGAVRGLYGGKSKIFKRTFQRDVEENYGNLSIRFTITDTTKNYLIQLLNEQEEIINSRSIKKNSVLNYTTYPVGKYSFRIVYDENNNDKWDTGNVKKGLQPEKTWNAPTEITLRANWDLEEKITIPPPPQ